VRGQRRHRGRTLEARGEHRPGECWATVGGSRRAGRGRSSAWRAAAVSYPASSRDVRSTRRGADKSTAWCGESTGPKGAGKKHRERGKARQRSSDSRNSTRGDVSRSGALLCSESGSGRGRRAATPDRHRRRGVCSTAATVTEAIRGHAVWRSGASRIATGQEGVASGRVDRSSVSSCARRPGEVRGAEPPAHVVAPAADLKISSRSSPREPRAAAGPRPRSPTGASCGGGQTRRDQKDAFARAFAACVSPGRDRARPT